MRIAQVAPLYESVPPKLYGGTERVVSYLTEELVRRGHEVTLYASGDSETSARLVPCARSGLRLDPNVRDPLALHFAMLERVARDAREYDIVHYHTDYLSFAFSRRHRTPHVTTLHGRLDLPELAPIYREFKDVPLVSISHAQRRPLPWANWKATVYHGLPLDCACIQAVPGDYLVFLGRLSPEKRPDRAIEIARLTGRPLKIMGKVDAADRAYYHSTIRPLLKKADVEFLGEGGDRDKFPVLAQALALLFPIDWPEPFGLVQIEAMAVGTPVIAFPSGSVPEVIDPEVTGFIVYSVEEAAQMVERAASLDRARIRRTFEERFSVQRMVNDYEDLYETITAGVERVPRRVAPMQAARVQESLPATALGDRITVWRGDSRTGSATQGSATQGSATQGSATQGSATQDRGR
jgi:glycosyltransferase involved in cell wall biosynthesis